MTGIADRFCSLLFTTSDAESHLTSPWFCNRSAFSYLISINLPLFFLKVEYSTFLDHHPLLIHSNNLTVLERAGREINSKKPILLTLFIPYFSFS